MTRNQKPGTRNQKPDHHKMKIGLAQINTTIGAFEENVEKILHFYDEACALGADLVIFPEMAVSGYPPQDLLERREFVDAQEEALQRISREVGEVGMILGHFSRNTAQKGKPLYSSASLVYRGEIRETCHKRLLPTYDIFDETRYFEPGPPTRPVSFKGLRIGLTICEDIWTDLTICPQCRYFCDPVEDLLSQGIDCIVNVSASPFHLGKITQRLDLARHKVRQARCPLIFCNAIGGQDCLVFDGSSFCMEEGGRVFASLSAFEEDLSVLDLDERSGEIKNTLKDKASQAISALRLALKDYMGRTGFKKVVVGLSGGIDSSVTAAIAHSVLGPQGVVGVIMPSPYTSKESIEDAMALSRNLGIKTIEVPITSVFYGYKDCLSQVFSGCKEDVTEENLQARIRGNILMAISNKFGYLVLSTGNKSELAVGYCTLYGDLSGGYSLISDCPKTLVYEIAERINEDSQVIPERVLTKPPSAELRPHQRDEDDLPPYPVLDKVLKGFIEDNMTAREIVAMGIDPKVVEKVIDMIMRSEYKRRQAPFGPKITQKAFCCGRRWPVCHGFRPSATTP